MRGNGTRSKKMTTTEESESPKFVDKMLHPVAAILAFLMFCMMLLAAGFVSCLRCTQRCCGYKVNALPSMFYEDGFTFNITCTTLQIMYRDIYTNLSCYLKVGMPAPDLRLVSLDGISKTLFEFQKPGRPLVINFGSCT